ncbi:triose-phosphate transporter family-domain-containing protein, partial [Catenaria anguillulae PL171]
MAVEKRFHPSVYIAMWIATSSVVILYNKWILDDKDPKHGNFPYPIFLTTWHMVFMTIVTRIMKSHTNLLPGARNSKMTWQAWTRSVLPIGVFFSASLIFNNYAYLHLSVAFIQMLKAKTPLATLMLSAIAGLQTLTRPLVVNITGVVVGVIIASYGEIQFNLTGFIFQEIGIVFESARLVLMQKLMTEKLDPMSTMYFFAPVCAVINAFMFLVFEYAQMPDGLLAALSSLGYGVLLTNAMAAFALNMALVLLIGCTSSLVLTLCGVLKDILLISFSMIFFGTRTTFIQASGYSMALLFLTRYKTMNMDWRKEYKRLTGQETSSPCLA